MMSALIIATALTGQFGGQMSKRELGPMFQYQTPEARLRLGANMANFPLPVWVDQHGTVVSYIPTGMGQPSIVSTAKPPSTLTAGVRGKARSIGQRSLARVPKKRAQSPTAS